MPELSMTPHIVGDRVYKLRDRNLVHITPRKKKKDPFYRNTRNPIPPPQKKKRVLVCGSLPALLREVATIQKRNELDTITVRKVGR